MPHLVLAINTVYTECPLMHIERTPMHCVLCEIEMCMDCENAKRAEVGVSS